MDLKLDRRRLLGTLAAALALPAFGRAKPPLVEVWKDPSCGCCQDWLPHMHAIEGHVPASEVRRLLRERPPALGLVVPGMPIGSPGMDTPAYGGRRDAYSVLLLGKDGQTSVYASYSARAPG